MTQYNTLDDFLLFYHKERQQIPESIRKQLGDNINIRVTRSESDKNILQQIAYQQQFKKVKVSKHVIGTHVGFPEYQSPADM